jgi:hypothetical protein
LAAKAIYQIYDRILKRVLTLSSKSVILFINATFGRDFPLDSEITYNWTENVKNNLEKTISDTILTVITINQKEKFHIEVQINNDCTIVLRLFDYGYQDALKYKKVAKDKITLTFPQPKIIFLEHDSATPDEVTLELEFPNQGTFNYRVPAMKFLSYSVEELDKQHMVILLPLYLLKLRREIEKSKKKGSVRQKAAALKSLIGDEILPVIDKNEKAGNLTHHDVLVISGLLALLYDHLYGNIKEFKEEGVSDMVSEKLILPFEVEIAKAEKAIKAAEKAKKAAEKNALDVAKRLLMKGMAVDDIADATLLPIDKIMALQA